MVYVNLALYRLRDFLQIGRFVRVEAAGFRELCGGDVPREDASETLQCVVTGVNQRQMRCACDFFVAGEQDLRAARREFFGQLQGVGLVVVGRSEEQYWEAVMDDGHRPVLDFGGGEGFAL